MCATKCVILTLVKLGVRIVLLDPFSTGVIYAELMCRRLRYGDKSNSITESNTLDYFKFSSLMIALVLKYNSCLQFE